MTLDARFALLVREGRALGDAGVVHEPVDRAERAGAPACRVARRGHRRGVAAVELQRPGRAAARADRFGDPRAALERARGDEPQRSLARDAPADRLADAAATAGDEGDVPVRARGHTPRV